MTDKIYKEVRRLIQENEDLRKALDDLYDIQNGPPLCDTEKDWNEAMLAAEKVLFPTKAEDIGQQVKINCGF